VVFLGFDPSCVDDCTTGPLSVHRHWGVCFWLHPGGLFPGEGADAAPEGVTGGTWGVRASTEVMVRDFGSPWWWRRRTLFHCAGSADMAVDAAGYTTVPLCWG
jgi:hypothetical protein